MISKSIENDDGKVVDIDATIFGKRILIDVQMTRPNAPSYTQATIDTSEAASISEIAKISKLGPAAKEINALFIPFVVETYGRFPKHVYY